MAFRDIVKVMYDGSIKIDYKDKAHRYYAYPRVNFDVDPGDRKAWGKVMYPKGTTTLIGDTLEKKGLMTWPMGMALRELFGFYDFDGDNGRMTGYSKDVGTLWDGEKLKSLTKDDALETILSASKAWQRRQKKGADIGSVVHDAIENYILGNDFNILEVYTASVHEAEYASEAEKKDAIEQIAEDVKQAQLAFDQFKIWWDEKKPKLEVAEDLLYSKKHNLCGTVDAVFWLKKEHHPAPDVVANGKSELLITADWKTSNASKSRAAAMPQGVNYQYFVQSAIYEMMRREMGLTPADDLVIVSARKDGGFDTIFASEVGLTIDDCLAWAEATIVCYNFANNSKKELLRMGGM